MRQVNQRTPHRALWMLCGAAALAVGCAQACAQPDLQTLDPVRTLIVPAQGANLAPAARLLQEYLRKASHVESGFAIVAETSVHDAPDQFLLALGPTRWAAAAGTGEPEPDGFLIQRRGNVLVIRGGTDRGTLHGVVEFLHRFAQVRFYMPGDLWTSLPATPGVHLPAQVDLLVRPFVIGTMVTGMGGVPGDSEWVARNALTTRAGQAGSHQHNMWNVFNPERYAQKYPEIYPIVDGARYIPKDRSDQNWNPCFTSPQTLAAAEESALAYFEANPSHRWFSMGLQDSHKHCECEGCSAEFDRYQKEFHDLLASDRRPELVSTYTASPDAQPQWLRQYALSQLQWRLLNDLAIRLEHKLPGKWVEAMAYGVTSFAPRVKLHPNVMVFAQIHISDNIRGLMEPRPDGSLPIDRFIDASTPFGNHEWYRGEGHLVPRIYSGYWTRFLRHLKAKGKALTFHHIEVYPNWGMDGPKYWVLARSFWNPDEDAQALWNQFCQDMFGPAGDAMLQYFSTLERWYMQQSVDKGPKWGINRWAHTHNLQPEDLALMRQAREHLNEALRLAQHDQQRQRLALFDKTFRLSEMLFEVGTLDASPAKIAEVSQYFEQHIRPDPMTVATKHRQTEGFIDTVLTAVAKAAPKAPAQP